MGVIATAGGFFAYFSTLYWFGFTMNGLFGLQSGSLLTAVRGPNIKFGSYDYTAANLGNPYLNFPVGSDTVDCTKNAPSSTNENA